MFGSVLLIALVIAGQVANDGSRYSVAPGSGAQSDIGSVSDLNAAGSGIGPTRQTTEADTMASPRLPLSSRGGSDRNTIPTATAAGATDSRSMLDTRGARAFQDTAQQGYGRLQAPPIAAQGPGGTRTEALGLKPTALMREMLTAPNTSRLAGRPVPLIDVIAGAPSRPEQTRCVEAYWDLCSSVADYYLGLREQDELRQLIASAPGIGPMLQQAEKALAVRVGTAERAALASQYRLADVMGLEQSQLPLPSDMPHCGSYHTLYDDIFANRPSAEAHELSELLPLRYAELKEAAAAVPRAEEWVRAVAGASTASPDGTAMALDLLALRRRAFVQIARDYNRRIARYTELATPGEIGTDRLIGMLIKRDGPSTATRPSAPVERPNRQSNNSTGPTPNTFARGWESAGAKRAIPIQRDPSVIPAAAQTQGSPHEERSLLVTPR